ncbi:hypothetical protein HU200_010669 [Digitaria exilis]|uniref:PAS domain-containing protein n=1 Tax=Digitaria exilis TaxID=1010633 RepID=A0A835FIT0_9POAL|nr:hypothetical protein HU200_010669 [Digitaria exilis]CAB3481598.1 unnamed protein product [Digitaria exilis]CAB3483683.1 unnamed protein product [Digitaria exilis]
MDGEELMRKIRALEEGQAELKREVSKINQLRTDRRGGVQSQQPLAAAAAASPRRAAGLSRRHHAMVMQSLGQAVHVLDPYGKILYWNRNAEHLYGYSSAEAVGNDITRLIVHSDDIPALNSLVGKIFAGRCWRGNFPVKKKSGERFFVVADGTPLYHDDGSLIGLVCLSEDTQTLRELIDPSNSGYYYAKY